ncbi:MAG: hypothetical protein P1U63_09990 [Coxiellaceae bacterium]|nr:hypothetical protein [Coxiellaceae bacterium]
MATNHPPKTVGTAVQILTFSTIIFILFVITRVTSSLLTEQATSYHSISTNLLALGDAITYLIIAIVCLVGIHRGKNWARYLYLAYICARFAVLYLSHSFSLTTVTPVITLIVISYWLLIVIGITLLFCPESQCYFKGVPPPTFQDTLKRPQTVNTALRIQLYNLAVFIAGAIAAILYYRAIGQPLWHLSLNSTIEVLIDTPIHLIIMGGLLFAMYRQKAWARIVFTIYVIYRLLFHFYTIHYLAYTVRLEVLVYVFHALNFISLTLLFCPSSNRWFSSETKTPRSNNQPWKNKP